MARLRGLDGLRALAVAAVVAFHLDAPWLPGGFLGVDLFFVLSGFLITRQLLGTQPSGMGLPLRDFYLRRARRILPAAVVVVVACVADDQGVPLVFLEGSPSYYGARGFDDAELLGFRPPTLRYPPGAYRVARLSAYEDWMRGTFVYSDVFWAHDCVGLRGERLRALQQAASQ